MSGRLYRWPPAAELSLAVPKAKFYAGNPIALRQKFVSEVQRVVWAYKLADQTIHLRGDAYVPEIQVFCVDAKDEDVSDDVLLGIDRAVPFPIIFEINRIIAGQASTRMVAAFKRLGGAAPRVSAYFATGWHRADEPRAHMPSAIDLSGLYSGLLAPLLPIATRPGEDLS
ncbi:hypothetical protein CTI14_28210, partial [Methylobacterium radiotolerans]